MSTSQGTFSASRPLIAAVSSIRLLVVSASAPVNTFSAPCFEEIRSAGQPPTPGFGEHRCYTFLCRVRRRTCVDRQAQSRESAVLSLRCQLRAFADHRRATAEAADGALRAGPRTTGKSTHAR